MGRRAPADRRKTSGKDEGPEGVAEEHFDGLIPQGGHALVAVVLFLLFLASRAASSRSFTRLR